MSNFMIKNWNCRFFSSNEPSSDLDGIQIFNSTWKFQAENVSEIRTDFFSSVARGRWPQVSRPLPICGRPPKNWGNYPLKPYVPYKNSFLKAKIINFSSQKFENFQIDFHLFHFDRLERFEPIFANKIATWGYCQNFFWSIFREKF